MNIAIETETIRLDQLLKLAGLAGTGGESKIRIAEGDVSVNGEKELRRGRKIRPGDSVRIDDVTLHVISA